MKKVWNWGRGRGVTLNKGQTLVLVCLLATFSSCFYLLNKQTWQVYRLLEVEPCKTPPEYMREMRSLFRDTHAILNDFKLTHMLIYGTLFGGLRLGDHLPWDTDFDFALLTEELEHIDIKKLFKAFEAKGILIYYRPWKGNYKVWRNNTHGDLMLFTKTWLHNERGRTGLEPWLFFIHFSNFHQAPVRLFEHPLPTIMFDGMNVSVPREGMEIQKRFYPDDWWREVKPKGCN